MDNAFSHSDDETKKTEKEARLQKLETRFGVALSLFAALLAVNDLGAGKYGDDELQLSNEKTSSYLWYQSKGIKESLAEGQRDLLKTLLGAGSIRSEQTDKIGDMLGKIEGKLSRYKKEKAEILLGSAGVGKENWAQDVDGKMGNVVGAKQLEEKQSVLGAAGDRFDLASLFLQLSLVLGAIGLVFKEESKKRIFFASMAGLGVIGGIFSFLAYRTAGAF